MRWDAKRMHRLQYRYFLREKRHVDKEWINTTAVPKFASGYFVLVSPMLGLVMFRENHKVYHNAVDAAVIEGVDIPVYSPWGKLLYVLTVAEAVRMSRLGHGFGLLRGSK